MGSHLHAAPAQPATRWVDYTLGPAIVFRSSPQKLIRCRKCKRRRWALHCQVQVYYDDTRVTCAPGHGCQKAKRKS